MLDRGRLGRTSGKMPAVLTDTATSLA